MLEIAAGKEGAALLPTPEGGGTRRRARVRVGRKGNRHARLRLVETLDAFILYCRRADLDADVDLLEPDFYSLFGDLGDFLEDGLVAVQGSGGSARFKYLLVPKRRNGYLQRALLCSFVGGVPHLLPAGEVSEALLGLSKRTIFNGLPLRCVSMSEREYLLAFALPKHISELVWQRGLAGKMHLSEPKVLYPSLNLFHVEGAARLLKANDAVQAVSLCFGGLYEYYARFPMKVYASSFFDNRGSDATGSASDDGSVSVESGATQTARRKLSRLKQAAFLEHLDRAYTYQLLCSTCGVDPDWRWADQNRDFSRDLSAEVLSMDKLTRYKREDGVSVCRCSPHLRALAELLNRKGIKTALFLGYFLGSLRLDQLRMIFYAVALDAASGELRLFLWWPHFGRSRSEVLSASELKRLAELEEDLLTLDLDDTEDLLDLCLTDLFYQFEIQPQDKTVKLYFMSPFPAMETSEEEVIAEECSWLKNNLPKFCRRCGLFLPFTDELLWQVVQREQSLSVCDAETEWVN